MGLLSDPEYGSVRLVKILRKVHKPLCSLCYIGALAWFMMLGNRAFNNETYFSENALLPGLVTNEFNGEQAAKQFYNELLKELEDKYEDNGEMPVPWLVGKMSQIQLEVYTHNFTLNYPLGNGQIYHGTNVYGIVRAARAGPLEALVFSVPYRAPASHHKQTTAGLALLLAFAQFARPQKYWAKDLIFLVTEHEQLGMQAWLEAYHGIHSDKQTFYTSLGSFWKPKESMFDFNKLGLGFNFGEHEKWLDPGKLHGRSGSIQAAINLEFHTPKIKFIEVKIEGLNGQLPNLDLVNLVHKLCDKSGIHHSYKYSYSWIRRRDIMDEWFYSFRTMLEMFTRQLAGVPNGNHGLFHRFGIEALTLEGFDENDPDCPPRVPPSAATFRRLGLALESTARSLNNLLERFHQSYFFYLLAATNRFISIGQYMPSLCLLCVAMLVRALALWVTLQTDGEENQEKPPKEESKQQEEKDKEVEELIKKTGEVKKKEEASLSLVNIGVNYLLVHLFGYLVMNSPLLFSYLGAKYLDLPSEMSTYYGLCIASVILAVVSTAIPRLLFQAPMKHEEMCLLNVLVLIELSTICLSIGMHNFPLGLCVALVYTPLASTAGVVTEGGGKLSVLSKWLSRGLCLISQPLVAVTIAMCLYGRLLYPEESPLAAAARGRDAAMQATLFSIVDSMIYGNWLFNVASTLILPTWLVFWQILNTPVAKR